MNSAPCEICGRVNLASAPVHDKTHPIAQMLRLLLQAPGWKTHLLTLGACALAIDEMTRNWVVPFPGLTPLALILAAVLACSSWAARGLTRVLVWVFVPATRRAPRPGRRHFLVLPVALLGIWVLQMGHIPLRVGFWLSRGDLEKVAVTAKRPRFTFGSPVSSVGLYGVTYAIGLFPITTIVVASNHPSGADQAAFIHCAGGCGPFISQNQAFLRGRTWITLSPDWGWSEY